MDPAKILKGNRSGSARDSISMIKEVYKESIRILERFHEDFFWEYKGILYVILEGFYNEFNRDSKEILQERLSGF